MHNAILIAALLSAPADLAPPKPAAAPALSEEDKLEEQRAAALELHDKAGTSRKKADRKKAIAAYQRYLKDAGDKARDPDEVYFFIAELLHDDQRYADASGAFGALVVKYPESRFALQASWRAFYDAELHAKTRRGRVHQQRVIDAATAYVGHVDRMLAADKYVEEDERASALWALYETAKKLGDTKAANGALQRLAKDFPDDVYGQNAEQLLNPPK